MKVFLILWISFVAGLSCLDADDSDPLYIGYSDYQILTDRSFDAAGYFKKMQQAGVNLQRIWATGYGNTDRKIRELQPFARRGRKYDLMRIDSQYVARMHRVFRAAESAGQRVLFTLFDRWQMATADRFVQTPWYYRNNTSRVLKNAFPDFYSENNKDWMRIQENFVRTLVRESRQFHPIYEVMNEAKLYGDCDTLIRWHERVASWILDEAPDAEIAVNTLDDCPALFEIDSVQWVSLHYNAWSGGICDAVRRAGSGGRKVLIDTDGAMTQRVDNKLVQDWLQESVQCGASFNHKDSIYDLDTDVLHVIRERMLPSAR